MTAEDTGERIGRGRIELVEAFLGYDILVDGEHAGAIEGVPGHLEYIELDLHWEGKGVGRAAIQEFVSLSRELGETEVSATNATSDAAEHILETEGFRPIDGGVEWILDDSDSEEA